MHLTNTLMITVLLPTFTFAAGPPPPPAPPVVETPVPITPKPTQLPSLFCTFNEDCRVLGDSRAMCVNNACQCSDVTFVPAGNAPVCAPRALLESVLVTISIEMFFNRRCRFFTEFIQDRLMELLTEIYHRKPTNLNLLCGHAGEDTTTVTISIQNISPELAASNLPFEFRRIYEDDFRERFESLEEDIWIPSVSQITYTSSYCTLDGASETRILPTGECVALSCQEDYRLIQNVCIEVEDTDLQHNEIAVIVLGGIFGFVLILAFLFILKFNNSAPKTSANDDDGEGDVIVEDKGEPDDNP